MSSNTTAPARGVLVTDSDGAVSWWSAAVAAVAETLVHVTAHASVTVDAADPSTVLAWASDPGCPAEVFDRVFTAPAAPTIRAARARGESTTIADGWVLHPGWAVRAQVAAVDRWGTRPLRHGVLRLDTADADHAGGRAADAARILQRSVDTLLDLGEEAAAGDLPPAAATRVAELLRTAAGLLDGRDGGEEVAAAARALDEGLAAGDTRLWADLLATALTAGAINLGLSGTSLGTAAVDPLAVTPRTLAWGGADTHELLVTHEVTSGTAASVVVTATLAATTDPLSAEARNLVAYAAVAATGELVRAAPMQVRGRSVTARLDTTGHDPDTLHVGVYSAWLDAAPPRVGATDLVKADRLLLDAWNHQRAALAALHSAVPGVAPDRIDELQAYQAHHLRTAKALADKALAILDTVLAATDPATPGHRRLRARITAAERYYNQLDSPAGGLDALTALLAELLLAPGDADPGEDDGR